MKAIQFGLIAAVFLAQTSFADPASSNSRAKEPVATSATTKAGTYTCTTSALFVSLYDLTTAVQTWAVGCQPGTLTHSAVQTSDGDQNTDYASVMCCVRNS